MIVSNEWLSQYLNGLPKSPITIEQMNSNLRISNPFIGFVIKDNLPEYTYVHIIADQAFLIGMF